MRLFTVTTEQLLRRRLRVAAANADEALASVRAVLPPTARVIDAAPVGRVGAELGQRALDHILSRDFVEWDADVTPTLGDWVVRACRPEDHAAANDTLATAGLRVTKPTPDGLLCFGSPVSIPVLGRWCHGQPFAGGAFLPALAAIDGAQRHKGMTFAGTRSRVVALPLSFILAQVQP